MTGPEALKTTVGHRCKSGNKLINTETIKLYYYSLHNQMVVDNTIAKKRTENLYREWTTQQKREQGAFSASERQKFYATIISLHPETQSW